MEEGGERDCRLRGGSEGEGDGDRGRLKRKGFVGLEEEGAVVEEEFSGAEVMVRRSGVDHLLTTFHTVYVCLAKDMLLRM